MVREQVSLNPLDLAEVKILNYIKQGSTRVMLVQKMLYFPPDELHKSHMRSNLN